MHRASSLNKQASRESVFTLSQQEAKKQTHGTVLLLESHHDPLEIKSEPVTCVISCFSKKPTKRFEHCTFCLGPQRPIYSIYISEVLPSGPSDITPVASITSLLRRADSWKISSSPLLPSTQLSIRPQKAPRKSIRLTNQSSLLLGTSSKSWLSCDGFLSASLLPDYRKYT